MPTPPIVTVCFATKKMALQLNYKPSDLYSLVVCYVVKTTHSLQAVWLTIRGKFCTINFLTTPISVAFFDRIIKFKKKTIKKCIILADHVHSTCVWSDYVGVSIIFYLYVFNLTKCGLQPWSSWTANSDKKYMELNGVALNVNKPCVTSRKTAFRKDK